jgi:hypothetical protein
MGRARLFPIIGEDPALPHIETMTGRPAMGGSFTKEIMRWLHITGGMILFDTRDADLGGFGGTTPEGRRLQEIAAQLDIPPLEPVPSDHVLTRTFYLLQDFPGRHAGRSLGRSNASHAFGTNRLRLVFPRDFGVVLDGHANPDVSERRLTHLSPQL